MKTTSHGQTHAGLVRDNNEDTFVLMPDQGLFVVADGMAGHRSGELASAICVKTMQRFFESPELEPVLLKQLARLRLAGSRPPDMAFHQFKLLRGLEESNAHIFQTAQENPQYETMGTTVVAVLLYGRTVFFAHVGDSRIYRWRNGTLEQMTADHSLLNEYLRLNLISAEEAETFPMKNVIVRALGLKEHEEVDVGRSAAERGDWWMLCSDGLSDLVKLEQMAEAFSGTDDPAEVTRRLEELALAAGGLDNVTSVVVRIEDF
jgi:protein phosphatase